MPKPRVYGPKILELLNKGPLTRPEITKKLKIDRKTVGDNLKWAEKKNLINSVLGKYHITPLGKYHLTRGKLDTDSSEVLTDSVSFEVVSQIIDSLNIREESPKGKCTIQMEDAKKIKELDDKTIYSERFITHDGLGLPENDTYLKQAVADVVDIILDFRAKAKGALTILDQELRDQATVFNTDIRYPGFDYRKRYEDLADINFAVLIEFEGKKWVESQISTNLENSLDNSLEVNRELYVQSLRKLRLSDLNIRISKAIYNIMGGSGRKALTEKSLEANRLFYSTDALRDYIRNWFKVYQVDQLHMEDIIQKGFESGYFEIEEQKFYHLKFNKAKKLRFFNSIPLNNHLWPSNTEDIQGQSKNQISEAGNFSGIDDIISKVSSELDLFEKALFDLLTKLVERIEKAKMQDKVVDTSQIRTGKQPLHLINAENALGQLFYIFHTVVNAYILRFMKLTEKGIVDEQLQSKGLLLIITKLANMRKAVRQALNSFHGGRLNTLFYDNIYDKKMIQGHANAFKDAGIMEEVEPLLHSVAQIYEKVELGS
jgi:hypothetical protein